MNTRSAVILIVGIGATMMLLCAGVATVGYFYVQRAMRTAMTAASPPAALAGLGVISNAGLIEKSVLIPDPSLGKIGDLVATPKPGMRMGIAGSNGALFLDESLAVASRVPFASPLGHVEFVDVEGDGKHEYLNRGGGWGATHLLDDTGRILWQIGGMPGVDDMAAGDIDGDGVLDFVVGMNGGGGVVRLDRHGKTVWKQSDGNVWHVEIVDTDGDGVREIVHSNAAGQITIRDAAGAVRSRSPAPAYFSHFSLCRWPTRAGKPHLLFAADNTIFVLDFSGAAAVKFTAPNAGNLGTARGTPVRLMEAEPECFAVVVQFEHWNKSVFYVFDQHHAVLYEEILGESCGALLAVPRDGSTAEDLLLGGAGTVWKYTVAPAKPADEKPQDQAEKQGDAPQDNP